MKAEKGKLDVVFANAAVAERSSLEEVTEEHIDRHFDVNVRGTIFTVQKALPLFRSGASIIVNASISGFMGEAGLGIYGATKAALRNLVRTWVVDLKGRGIRVNAISPGRVVTPGLDGLAGPGADLKAFYDYLSGFVPLGRSAQPSEIANVVAFLASDEASYVNGSGLPGRWRCRAGLRASEQAMRKQSARGVRMPWAAAITKCCDAAH